MEPTTTTTETTSSEPNNVEQSGADDEISPEMLDEMKEEAQRYNNPSQSNGGGENSNGSSEDSGPFDPLKNLTEEHMKALEEIRLKAQELTINDEERAWCNDRCLLRYLRARDYNVKKAEKLLQGTIEWIREAQPTKIKIEDVEPIARTGCVYLNGFDKKGRPILLGKPAREGNLTNPVPSEIKFKHLLYWLELGFSKMDQTKGIETFCLLVDYKDYNRRHMDMKANMAVMHCLINHCPERLGVSLFLDPPFLFWIGWKMISPFLNEVTMSKVRFIYSEKKDGKRYVPALFDYIDEEVVEEELGGLSKKVYDYDSYIANNYNIL